MVLSNHGAKAPLNFQTFLVTKSNKSIGSSYPRSHWGIFFILGYEYICNLVTHMDSLDTLLHLRRGFPFLSMVRYCNKRINTNSYFIILLYLRIWQIILLYLVCRNNLSHISISLLAMQYFLIENNYHIKSSLLVHWFAMIFHLHYRNKLINNLMWHSPF